MVVAEERAAERVGRFTLTVTAAEDNPESRQRWERRSDALAAWLMSEWQRERAGHHYHLGGQSLAERN